MPVLAFVNVEASPSWFPTLLALGAVVLPTGIGSPFILAVVVLARDIARRVFR